MFKLIGIAIFVYILFQVDFPAFIQICREMDLAVFSLAFVSILVLNWSHALKWWYFLDFMSIRVSIWDTTKIFWTGMFLGLVTPAKLGEVLKVYFISAAGQSRLRALLSVIIDRASDLFTLLAVGIFSAVMVFEFEINLTQLAIFIGLFSGLTILILSNDFRLNIFVQRILERYAPILATQFLKLSLKNIFSKWKQSDKKSFFLALGVLFFCWALYFASRYLVALSLGLPLSLKEVIACVSLSTIVSLVPITVGGIGTREAAMIYLFSFFGLNMEHVIAFAMLVLISDIFFTMFGLIPYFQLSAEFKLNLKSDATRIKDSILSQNQA